LKHLISASLLIAIFFTACATPKYKRPPKIVKTYLVGEYKDPQTASELLVAEGFEILTTIRPFDDKDVVVIVLTSDYLKKIANIEKRGLLADAIRVTINADIKELRVTNPLYYFKAYMQEDYKMGSEEPVLKALLKALPSLSATVMIKDSQGTSFETNKEALEYVDLADYHYMIGMPYYHTMDILAEASSISSLMTKVKKKSLSISNLSCDNRRLSYILKLSANRYVVGMRLSSSLEKFIKSVDVKNISLLPWSILIETREINEKRVAVAATLNGKYSISLAHPSLTMETFMKIATVPGDVQSDLMTLFK
jgi:hypothetical protein